jgi:hypothetical protein
MTQIRHQPIAPTRTRRLAAGGELDAHQHDDHRIVYAGQDVLAGTIATRCWAAPAHRSVWMFRPCSPSVRCFVS